MNVRPTYHLDILKVKLVVNQFWHRAYSQVWNSQH